MHNCLKLLLNSRATAHTYFRSKFSKFLHEKALIKKVKLSGEKKLSFPLLAIAELPDTKLLNAAVSFRPHELNDSFMTFYTLKIN